MRDTKCSGFNIATNYPQKCHKPGDRLHELPEEQKEKKESYRANGLLSRLVDGILEQIKIFKHLQMGLTKRPLSSSNTEARDRPETTT